MGKKQKKVRPLGAFVLVERNEAESTTQGGIIIPDSSQEKPLEATVVSVGKGRVDQKGNLSPLTVKKGDKVLFSKFGGAEVSINDQDLMVLEERDILAIIG
ncbi:MAG: co-chaperone GroES [Thermodesulfobacteriota bacterium]|jgi:chaperonin GroES|nr:co-chaperone GroES [bacterium]MDG2445548.1 co-chaperone GroES [Thermodesulfobacteriota bacterium]RZP13145.1 MAG: co-chaperone GroES [Candidatus Dadabacteria bacterium]MBT3850286.1 co-chaperone GroES [bacterium]MBT4435554.1 co-chaperone GroES [bacterium]|tara:strand:- start:138 stop:440 length:303 start_codon:yes stop_codon:yes gene_type:complete